MQQGFVFHPYDKKTSSSRKFKRIFYQKSGREASYEVCKVPMIKGLVDKFPLARRQDDWKVGRKHDSLDDRKSKQSMILIAKKIECHVDQSHIFMFGIKEDRKDDKKGLKSEEKRQEVHLESTMDDEEVRGCRVQPTLSHEGFRSLNQSFPKALLGNTEQSRLTSRPFSFAILSSKNNQELVRRILSSRKQWKEIKRGEGSPNFKWLAGDFDHSMFERTKTTHVMKKALNQLQFHQQITTKNGLIRNLQIYTETKKIELFSMTPITFLIDFDQEYCEFNLRQLLNFFIKNDTRPPLSATLPNKCQQYQKIQAFVERLKPYFNPHPGLRKRVNPLSRPLMQQEYLNGDGYLWLFKPTGLNRGRGIQIFDNLDHLEQIMLNYLQLAGRKPTSSETLKQATKKESPAGILPAISICGQKKTSEDFILKNCSFVIQKYIQRPFLLFGRKFDIRVWVLLNHDLTVYLFREGYLRTSSEQFSLDVSNYFIHLTNNAIQKHSKEYGLLESGNQISFDHFKKHLALEGKEQEFDRILSKMKEYCYIVLNSAKNKLNPKQQKYCFQIFGFDYILDEHLKVWLIQVNNNPCIELSSPLLEKLIPRMLNDAFKLSLDKIFNSSPNPEEQSSSQTYSVDGYSDGENLWEDLGRLSPNSEYSPK